MKAFIKALEEEKSLLPVLGPVLLLPTLLLAGRTPNLDLAFIALVGTLLCFQWGLRGCAYALALLGLTAVTKHMWFTEKHLWQLGLEGSVGLSFFVSTLSSQQMTQFFERLEQQNSTKAKTIAHLEEELQQQRAQAMQEQTALHEKLGLERQALEEMQTELFSITVLNEVLRNANATGVREKEKCDEQLLQLERRAGQQRLELEFVQQELKRVTSEETLAQQNQTLFQELNAARFKEAQTHQINETLARLHAKVVGEKEELRVELEKVIALVVEKQPAPAPQSPSHFEQLYKQLKAQFEEKTNLLHQTRKELFRTDNELQTLKLALDQEALETDPLPSSLRAEIDQVLDEHKLLEELVSHLMHSTQESAGKKSKKKIDESSSQDLLF